MRHRIVWSAVLLLLVAVTGWRAFRAPGTDDQDRYRRLKREAADLRRQFDAAPPGGDRQRELQRRFGAANAERLDLVFRHPEWGLYESR